MWKGHERPTRPAFGATFTLWLAALALGGCDGDDPKAEADQGRDVGIQDTALIDADPTDAAPADAGPMPADAAPVVDARVEPLPPLSLNSLIPNRGLSTGGTPIRVIGTGFAEGIELTLDGRACADLVVESENLLRCTTPPAPRGRPRCSPASS